jgi:hypothetical protein
MVRDDDRDEHASINSFTNSLDGCASMRRLTPSCQARYDNFKRMSEYKLISSK